MLSCCAFKDTIAKKPSLNTLPNWPNAINSKSPVVDLPHLYWWQQFHNAELNSFMQKTLANNTDLQVAYTRTMYAMSQIEQIKFSFLPKLNFLVGYSQFPVLGNPASIAMFYPAYLNNLLQSYYKERNAKQVYQASIYQADSIKLAMLSRCAIAFFTLIAQEEDLALHNTLIADYAQYLHLTEQQYKSGLISYDNIANIESKIKILNSDVDLIQHNIVLSTNALHYLFNEDPGKLHLHTKFSAINSDAIIPGNLPVSVLKSRPDIKEQGALLKAAMANLDAAEASFFPKVNLGAYLGAVSPGPLHLKEAYLVGPAIDMENFSAVDSADFQHKAQYLTYEGKVKQALAEVSNDFSAYFSYKNRLDNNTLAMQDKKQSCSFAQARVSSGLSDGFELISCQLELDLFAITLNHNKLDKMLKLVNLYQDLGGGYEFR
jgi:outer membrane protein, multidrug efflux system